MQKEKRFFDLARYIEEAAFLGLCVVYFEVVGGESVKLCVACGVGVLGRVVRCVGV